MRQGRRCWLLGPALLTLAACAVATEDIDAPPTGTVAAAGGGGTLTGSVTYAIEGIDSQSGKVVAAAVRRLTPGAFDLSSTLGTMETARAVARDAAAKLRARLDSLHAG